MEHLNFLWISFFENLPNNLLQPETWCVLFPYNMVTTKMKILIRVKFTFKLCKSLFYANYVNICSILLVSVRNEMFLMLPSQGFSPLFTISSRQESAFSKDFLRVNFLNQLHLLHFHTSIENLLRKRCTCRQAINIDMSQLFVFHNQSSTCMGILQNVVYFFSTDVNEAMQPLVLEFCELP